MCNLLVYLDRQEPPSSRDGKRWYIALASNIFEQDGILRLRRLDLNCRCKCFNSDHVYLMDIMLERSLETGALVGKRVISEGHVDFRLTSENWDDVDWQSNNKRKAEILSIELCTDGG